MKVNARIPQVKKLRLTRRPAANHKQPAATHAAETAPKGNKPARRPAFLSSLLRVAASPRQRRATKKAEHARMLDAEAHKRRQAILKQHRQTVPAMSAAVVSRPLALDTPGIAKPAAPVTLTIKHRQPAGKPTGVVKPVAVKTQAQHPKPKAYVPDIAPKPIPKQPVPAAVGHQQQHQPPQPAATTSGQAPRPSTARVQSRRYPVRGHIQRPLVHAPISRTLSLDGMRG